MTGSDAGAWGARDPNIIDIHLDKTTYRPGDTAHAIVQSPFPDADILVAVVRNGVMWQQRIRTRNTAPSIAFTVTPDMLPNAAFEAIAVRRGALPAAAVNAGNAVVRSGFASFNVALDRKYITVAAVPEHARMHPGDQQTVRLHLSDAAHHPVRGQVTLIVANDAVLAAERVSPARSRAARFTGRNRSRRASPTIAPRSYCKPAKKVEDKGWGYGGGLSTGAEDTRIRRKFDALAYYNASIVTDAGGNATASFDLPDDLTTWRIMAVAATTDGRFGNGESTFLTNKTRRDQPGGAAIRATRRYVYGGRRDSRVNRDSPVRSPVRVRSPDTRVYYRRQNVGNDDILRAARSTHEGVSLRHDRARPGHQHGNVYSKTYGRSGW